MLSHISKSKNKNLLNILSRNFSSKSEIKLVGHRIASLNEESNKNIIFLHGLLCQGRHWRSFALSDAFSQRGHCHLVDLRNHGESAHHNDMSYKTMAEDVVRYADNAGVDKFELVGHAMGGKLAMTTATLFQDRVESVISIEAAPVDNNHTDPNILKGNIQALDNLLSMNIEGKTRKSVVDMLNGKFADKGIAALVSMNIVYDGEQSNTVKWCSDLPAIRSNLPSIVGFEQTGQYTGPFLSFYGMLSRKFPLEDFQKVFPK
jgi:esterase